MPTPKRRAGNRARRQAESNRSYDWPIVRTFDPDEAVCRLKRGPNGGQERDAGTNGTGNGRVETTPPGNREIDGPSTSGVTPSAAPMPPAPERCNGALYRVTSGDTIFRIASAHGVTMDAVIDANPQVADPDQLTPGQLLCIPARTDGVTGIFNLLLTAEKVETAMYAQGLRSPALQGLPAEQFAYFEAGLSHEYAHIQALEALGASVPYEVFYFPPGAFESLEIFVNTLLELETAGVSAYIQASVELARMGRFDLSRLADQIMGVEAEHRALLREVLDLIPAANLCFERAPDQPIAVTLAALPNFLRPNQFDGQSVGPVPLPTGAEVAELAGDNACPNPRPEL